MHLNAQPSSDLHQAVVNDHMLLCTGLIKLMERREDLLAAVVRLCCIYVHHVPLLNCIGMGIQARVTSCVSSTGYPSMIRRTYPCILVFL